MALRGAGFRDDFQTILFDHVGAADPTWPPTIPGSTPARRLRGRPDEIGQALELRNAVYVGHSVSAMIGVLAALQAPQMFECLVLVGPSPRYIDDEDYVGGFSESRSMNCWIHSPTTRWDGPPPWRP